MRPRLVLAIACSLTMVRRIESDGVSVGSTTVGVVEHGVRVQGRRDGALMEVG